MGRLPHGPGSRPARYSECSGDDCVEVASCPATTVHVRGSKDKQGPSSPSPHRLGGLRLVRRRGLTEGGVWASGLPPPLSRTSPRGSRRSA
ncbi:DUF397 domain-containing protein [Streptomyces sp. NPDC056821]|uniref:DUF397 domain-containing protein n=1 Tax=unclassified Streptomyces TaxID=2593676 RepID=UPI0036CD06DB